MANIHRFEIAETVNGKNVIEVAGESQAEARCWGRLAGWTIESYIGIKAKLEAPKHTTKYANYREYCDALGISY